MVDILDSARSYSHSALNKMTRKNAPQKKNQRQYSLPQLQNMDYNSMSESQFRSTIIKLLVALEKSIKDSRGFMLSLIHI